VKVLGSLLFVLALLISVVLHEAGHMWCARWSGGKVTEFFVGFGTKLWSFRRGETEYGIKAIPAGGYVKIVGMTDLDEIEPGDEDRALKNMPARKRLLTLSAGSLMHFVIALFLFAIVALAFGVRNDDTTTIGAISCATKSVTAGCTAGDPTPAKDAGLQIGDVITSVNGKPVSAYTDLVAALHALPAGRPATLTYTRDGTTHTTTVTPETGQTYDANSKVITVPMVGIAGSSLNERSSPLGAVRYSGSQFWSSITGTFTGLGGIPGEIPQLFSSTVNHTARSINGPVGVVGMAQVSGQLFGAGGFSYVLLLVASINVFIGIFNLLPILPLDGGHIAILLYEEARKRVYRLLRRPAPGRVDLNKMMPVAYLFLLVFVGLTLLLVAADITNPIHLPS
jgi:membrane-associated protease RseP (regulator of RpoE activity)